MFKKDMKQCNDVGGSGFGSCGGGEVDGDVVSEY